MLASVMLPMVSASEDSPDEENQIIAGDLSDFDPANDGHAYTTTTPITQFTPHLAI
tara:strand:+ start:425 stop:592 length:168 start_codon:yes stop_codon:yes gene_type:complete